MTSRRDDFALGCGEARRALRGRQEGEHRDERDIVEVPSIDLFRHGAFLQVAGWPRTLGLLWSTQQVQE
jgi:hypothetical protein